MSALEAVRRALLAGAVLRLYPLRQGSVWSHHPVRVAPLAHAHDWLTLRFDL